MRPTLKFILTLLAVFLLTYCKKDDHDKVNIPDNNFLNILIQKGIDSDGDGKISYSEAEVVRSLDISGNNLSSLDVSNNLALTTLRCGTNQFKSLALSQNTHLEYLCCNFCLLSGLEVSESPKVYFSTDCSK